MTAQNQAIRKRSELFDGSIPIRSELFDGSIPIQFQRPSVSDTVSYFNQISCIVLNQFYTV
jgi:hypothetical protein